jgi:hypothetical protein
MSSSLNHSGHWIVWTWWLVMSVGCANSPEPAASPTTQATDRSKAKVDRAQQQAVAATQQAGPFDVRARLNPPDCDAPLFEIHAHGRWERAWLRASGTTQTQLDALRDPDSTVSTTTDTIRLRGEYTGSREADTGRRYPVFRVTAILDS